MLLNNIKDPIQTECKTQILRSIYNLKILKSINEHTNYYELTLFSEKVMVNSLKQRAKLWNQH